MIPTWLREVAPLSALNTRDVCGVLNVTSGQLDGMVRTGKFPAADFKTARCHGRVGKREWYVKTVIKHLKGDTK